MKVALIHDHLAQDGGAEKVLKVLTEIFPEAPIYTLLYDKNIVARHYKEKIIEVSIIQKLPWGVSHYKWYMPFMPMAVEFFDLSGYDLVISDASAFAKGVITKTDTLHICYCHTPTRYVWSDTHSYINELKYNKYFKKLISLVLNYIRIWDRIAADRVDSYIAISNFVAKRIKKYYRRESVVINPPVDIQNFKIAGDIGDYYLIGGRLVPYKRIDIVIEAFKKLGLKLKIYGDGIDRGRLESIAGGNKNIEFLGRVSEEEKYKLYSKCIAFINPQEEDFGITPIEAMASGRPVIAYGRGGVLETIIPGLTGEFFYEQTREALVEAVAKFDIKKYNPLEIRKHAEKYSSQRFKLEIKEFIDKELEKFGVR
jgi:glycosyltransferase involved in cell wall biosynthesis